MKPRDPKARSLAALQASLDRHGDERTRSAARGPEPWPGDLYALSETADLPVEWLVVERVASGQCRLVAADTNPALGSADVPVSAEMEGGPLSIRCAVSLEVGVETLRRGERTGTVAPEILDPVRRRLDELAAGSLDAAPDPELEDWHAEVLAPARRALLPPELKTPGPPPRHLGRRAALAAILLLLAALGGLSALAWRFHLGELQARSEIDRLVQEHQALEAEHQRQLAALREAQAREQRPPEPPPPEPPPPAPVPLQPLVNLAYASFYPSEARGDQREIAVPSQATHLFLLFYVGDREPCKEYELEIARRGSAPFTIEGLKPLSGQEVSVAVPRPQLPDGSYQLRLHGMCEGERRELSAYEARLQEISR